MNARSFLLVPAIAGLLLGCPHEAGAHRLDEYLQATRVSVERNRVILEMDLTAGMSVAPVVFSLIDANGDGRISKAEGENYAKQVFAAIEASVDGAPIAVTLVRQQFPEYREMNAGVGVIRLIGAATFPASGAGTHELLFRNSHQPKMSVYLANALVPTDDQIEINGQSRDVAQCELTINYRVSPHSPPSRWWFVAGLALAGVLSLGFLSARDLIRVGLHQSEQ